MKRIALLALALGLVFSTTASATSVFVDFGDSSQQTANNYNNLWTNNPAQLSVANAIDSSGNSTGISVTAQDFWPGSNQTGTSTPGGTAATIFDPQATRDNVFGNDVVFGGFTAPNGKVLLSGLNPALTYDFVFFGSRMSVSDNRETKYDVSGANSGIGLLNTTNNTDNVASVLGIQPTGAGAITISVTKGPNNNNGSGFYYLGAMKLSYVPEPTSILLLMSSAVVLVVSRSGSRLS